MDSNGRSLRDIKRAILDKFALINQNIYAMETDLNAF